MARIARFGRYSFPLDLFYSDEHVWVRVEDEDVVRMGFDDALAKGTHKIFVIDLPKEQDELLRGEEFAVVESSKAVVVISSPITGLVTAVNHRVSQEGPSVVVAHAYDEGWLVQVKASNLEAELRDLMHGEEVIPWVQEIIRTQALLAEDRKAAETVTIDEI